MVERRARPRELSPRNRPGRAPQQLAAMGVLGMNELHRANGIKNFLGICINAVAVLIFSVAGYVVWQDALLMACGALAGGYCGFMLGTTANAMANIARDTGGKMPAEGLVEPLTLAIAERGRAMAAAGTTTAVAYAAVFLLLPFRLRSQFDAFRPCHVGPPPVRQVYGNRPKATTAHARPSREDKKHCAFAPARRLGDTGVTRQRSVR